MDAKIADEAVEQFDRYYVLQDKLRNGQFNDLGVEVRKRLVQTRNLLIQVVAQEKAGLELHEKLGSPWPKDSSVDINDWMKGAEFRKWEERAKTAEWKAL